MARQGSPGKVGDVEVGEADHEDRGVGPEHLTPTEPLQRDGVEKDEEDNVDAEDDDTDGAARVPNELQGKPDYADDSQNDREAAKEEICVAGTLLCNFHQLIVPQVGEVEQEVALDE